MNPSGSEVWRVSGSFPECDEVPTGRVRKNFPSKKKAEEYRSSLESKLETLPPAAAYTRLSPPELVTAEAATLKLKLSDRAVSLIDCVDYYLKHNRVCESIHHDEARKRFLRTLRDERQVSDRHVASLRSALALFFTFVAKVHVNEVTAEDARKWIFSAAAPQTRKNRKSYLHNFFSWAVQNHFATFNPASKVNVRGRSQKRQPAILTVEECRSLLTAAKDHLGGLMFPYALVTLMTGLRPEEARRVTTWDAFELDVESPVLAAFDVAKTVDRYIELQDNLVEMLRWCRFRKLQPGFFTQKRWMEVRELAGLGEPWTEERSDICRHSYASYTFAKTKDYRTLSYTMGNSEDVLRSRYIVPVKPDASHAFSQLSVLSDAELLEISRLAAAS